MHSQGLATVEESLNKLSQESSRIRGFFDSLIEAKAENMIVLEDAREFLETKDEVQDALNALHQQSVERTRILYEDVLTGLVKDIFPNDPENHRVHLNLSVKRGQAALAIEVSNIYGHRRDVFLDKGGSVKSIIAIGLRFIALSRTNRRRFVAFDEVDKEINELLIPRFANMMAQLASKIGMQVLYISHHKYQDFEGHARIIRLSRKNGKVVSDIVSDNGQIEFEGWEGEENVDARMEDAGFTEISLMNVKQHQNTVIELSPQVNVIIGANDIGKSTIIQALECVARNKGRQGLIRDDQDKARIELGLEGRQRLVFQYKRRASKRGKTKYELYNHHNEVVHDSFDGNNCPDWLHGFLGMETYKNQDLHIALQGASNFMLDVNVSDQKRAEILSLNKLCGQSQRFIERHNELIDQHKKATTQARKGLAKTKQKLALVASLGDFDEILSKFQNDLHLLRRRHDHVSKMSDLLARWEDCNTRIEAFGPIRNMPTASDLVDSESASRVAQMKTLINDISCLRVIRDAEKSALSQMQEMPELVEINTRLTDILDLGKRWGREQKLMAFYKSALEKLRSVPEDPVVQLDQGKKGMIESLVNLDLEMKRDLEEIKMAKSELIKTQGKLQELSGQSCPTCGGEMNFNGVHSHA